jgi:hypothetical protein
VREVLVASSNLVADQHDGVLPHVIVDSLGSVRVERERVVMRHWALHERRGDEQGEKHTLWRGGGGRCT